ncbi:glycosyltransferase family protein [Azospirillum canadense]|uniref:hypothetical protein n=1 Tax=Azospirillum canadense TaxID=403962 RepID=UPI002227A716|nr:hypothetical protein [Azospirillum canadense]MCW2240924.1 hypothetical protein [Azospirillum canadense]
MITQGYLTIATGHPKYLAMAANLAVSLRRFDPKRRICLMHDHGTTPPAELRALFDDCVLLPDDDRYSGCANKLRVYSLSPYDQTMFVDADCLLLSHDIDLYWDALQGYDFTVAGERRRNGFWNQLDIAAVCARFEIDYIVQMNSGVFFFKKTPTAASFFARANELYLHDRDRVSYIHKGASGQYADEPILGVTMGLLGLQPLHKVNDRSWMVTTWRACGFRYDAGSVRFSLRKFNRFLFGRLPTGWVWHSPMVVHFIGLRPRGMYRRLVRQLLHEARTANSRATQFSG